MESFYGGPNGKSFDISWIFSTRWGSGNSLENDINKGWESPISVGSFVVISYGDPNTKEYDNYLEQDLQLGSETSYNSTLWQKVYNQEKNKDNGIDYKLIMSMAGFTPRLGLLQPTTILDADQDPKVILNTANLDKPILEFRLPRSQVLSMIKPITVLNANQKPEVIYNDDDINNPTLTFKLPQSQVLSQLTTDILKADQIPEAIYDDSNVNRPTIKFKLPVSQILSQLPTEVLKANQNPQVIYNDSDIDHPTLKFKLPKSQTIGLKPTETVNADIDPSVTIDNSDINNPKLTFKLPQQQILSLQPTEILKANQEPEVVYNDDDINNPTLTFKLPLSQVFSVAPIEVLNADQKPDIVYDDTDPDNPVIKFKLPQSQILSQLPTEILDANEDPEAVYNDTNINNPTLQFKLPQSQLIQLGSITWIKANENPKITLDTTNINQPRLNFQLPVSQEIQEGTTTVLNANEDPRFEIDNTDIDNPVFNLWLPQSQIMQQPDLIVGGPTVEPAVNLDNTNINAPKLEFTLPRAVEFFYGNLLNERDNSPYTLTNESFKTYEVGDYYIGVPTGFIYKVIEKPAIDQCKFEYLACIQAPIPDVEAEEIWPYTDDGEQNSPTIKRVFTNSSESAWKIVFGLPKAPKPEISVKFIGAAEKAKANLEITDPETLTFQFDIPQGSRIYTDIQINEINCGTYQIEGSKVGDLCLNTATGKVFAQTAINIWQLQQYGLKGPQGDALHIVKTYIFNKTNATENTLSVISALVEADFKADQNFWIDTNEDGIPDTSRMPKNDELISVIWEEDQGNIGYWYYYNEYDGWKRVALTGNFVNSISTDYIQTDDIDKVYNTNYINNLIKNEIPDSELDLKTFNGRKIIEMLSWKTFEELNGEENN